MTTSRVLIPLAEGVEEMEAVITVDVLRRAGIEVVTLGLDDNATIKASRGVVLGCDAQLTGEEDGDMIVLPGGADGAERLAKDERVHALLRRFEAEEKWIAAICAGPIALVAAGVGKGKEMTSHPSVREQVEAFAGSYSEEPIVIDDRIITSRGPGCAFDFSLALVGMLEGAPKAGEVRMPMMFPH